MANAAAREADTVEPGGKENKTRTNPSLIDLDDDACRYPVGRKGGWRQKFCGLPTASGPYCPACQPKTRIAGSAMSREEAAYWAAVAAGAR